MFFPNWPVHNRRAPFLANDEMLIARIRGAILFGAGGIGLNLAEKAGTKGLHVARIPKPETQRPA